MLNKKSPKKKIDEKIFKNNSLITNLLYFIDKFTKLNIDSNPDNTQKFGIRGIPTIMLFKNGEKAATSVGVLSKSELTNFLNENT